MISKIQIVIFTILCALNFMFSENYIVGSTLAALQLFVICGIFIATGSIKKTFYWHMLFLFSSLEITLNIGGYYESLYNYKSFRLPFLPIAVSTFVTIFLFLIYVIKSNGIKYRKNDLVYKTIVLFFFLPLITGVIGLLFRGYEVEIFFNRAMQPFIYICVYSLLFQYINSKDIEKLKTLIISTLIGSVIASFLSGFLGVGASYGVQSTLPMNQIMIFSPFLICLALYYNGKNRLMLLFIGGLACVNLLLFNATGKVIIFVAIAISVFLLKMATNYKRVIWLLLIKMMIIVASVSLLDYIIKAFKNNILFQAKLAQVIGLLNLGNWGVRFENIPNSPRFRIIETVNIYLTFKENITDLFIGRGFGGYFEDVGNYFNAMDMGGAFSEMEVMLGKYISPHESWNEVFLLTGLLGVFIWIILMYFLSKGVFKDNINSFYALIGLVFVAIFWNTFVILSYFGLLCVFVSQYNSKIARDKNLYLDKNYLLDDKITIQRF